MLLQLLNRCGDYMDTLRYHIIIKNTKNEEIVSPTKKNHTRYNRTDSFQVILKNLAHNPERNTMYLKEDCLHFRLYTKKID